MNLHQQCQGRDRLKLNKVKTKLMNNYCYKVKKILAQLYNLIKTRFPLTSTASTASLFKDILICYLSEIVAVPEQTPLGNRRVNKGSNKGDFYFRFKKRRYKGQ